MITGDMRRQIVGRHKSQQQSGGGPRIAQIDNIVRRRQPADPDTIDDPVLSRFLNTGTKRPQRHRGTQDILRFQQPGNRSPADRNSADHQGPVRNGFIAGDLGSSYQRVAGTACETGQKIILITGAAVVPRQRLYHTSRQRQAG